MVWLHFQKEKAAKPVFYKGRARKSTCFASPNRSSLLPFRLFAPRSSLSRSSSLLPCLGSPSSPRSSFFDPPCSLASLLAPRSSLALLFSPSGTSSFAFLLAPPLPRLSQGPPNDLTTRPCCEQSLCKPAAQYRDGSVQLNCVISAATDRGSSSTNQMYYNLDGIST